MIMGLKIKQRIGNNEFGLQTKFEGWKQWIERLKTRIHNWKQIGLKT